MRNEGLRVKGEKKDEVRGMKGEGGMGWRK